jgi:hypothetical protein
MASVIQAQICEDAASVRSRLECAEPVTVSKDANFFDFIPELAAELGGPVASVSDFILDQEAADDVRNEYIYLDSCVTFIVITLLAHIL